jgi:hypothetical protein
MGFENSKADLDFWMMPDIKNDGAEYYRYVICYIADVAVTMEEPLRSMDELASRFTLKEGSALFGSRCD